MITITGGQPVVINEDGNERELMYNANSIDEAVSEAVTEFQTQAEAIATEVIESIPADYTALDAEVDELDERLSNVEIDLKSITDDSVIDAFFGTNSVFASGANTNVVDLPNDADDNYTTKVTYSSYGFNPSVGSGQMYYFTPNFVSGKTYTLYIHYFGDWYSGADVYSNIRVFRGTTLISGNYYAEGESTVTFTFTSDGTEKIRFYVWNASVFNVYSVIAIAKTTAFSSTFSSLLSTAIGNNLKYGGHISASNYNTLIPDLDNAPVNTFYTGYTGDETKMPGHCPIVTTSPFVIKTYGTDGFVVYQEFTIFNNNTPQANPNIYSGNTWVRCLTGTPNNRAQFYSWVSGGSSIQSQINAMKPKVRPVITVEKSATADETNLVYNNFYKAMKYAYDNNCDVSVKAGEYDLVAEYIAVEGQTAYDNINNAWKGTPIGHGMTVKCEAEAYFTMKNTATTSANYLTIGQWLAPILPLNGGFVLDGWNCDAKNCRYVIHDGGYNNSGAFCNHEFVNCQMKLDNTDFENQQGLQTYRQCIGGGLLSGGIHVIVRNCIFESENVVDNAGIVSYHNVSDTTEGATSYNTYDIYGCYCKMGTIRFTYHGTETPVSPCKVHDNFVRSTPIFGAEAPSDTIINMEMLAWGNTITASA